MRTTQKRRSHALKQCRPSGYTYIILAVRHAQLLLCRHDHEDREIKVVSVFPSSIRDYPRHLPCVPIRIVRNRQTPEAITRMPKTQVTDQALPSWVQDRHLEDKCTPIPMEQGWLGQHKRWFLVSITRPRQTLITPRVCNQRHPEQGTAHIMAQTDPVQGPVHSHAKLSPYPSHIIKTVPTIFP